VETGALVAGGAQRKKIAEEHKYSSSRSKKKKKVAEGHKYSRGKRGRAASIRAGAGRP
jgi:hypothetical protein